MIVVSTRNLDEALSNDADVVEFRLDLFPQLPDIEDIKMVKKPKILTVRRPEDGGKFKGSEEERLKIFKKFAKFFEFADVEVYAEDIFFNLPCKVIESYHNFSKTPSFNELRDMIESKRGDIFKIAVMGKDKKDVVTITKILSEYNNVVAFLMGEKFSFTRIMAVLMGSPFIYCSAGKSVAPGQLTVSEVRSILSIFGL